jgi:hypothetical protein
MYRNYLKQESGLDQSDKVIDDTDPVDPDPDDPDPDDPDPDDTDPVDPDPDDPVVDPDDKQYNLIKISEDDKVTSSSKIIDDKTIKNIFDTENLDMWYAPCSSDVDNTKNRHIVSFIDDKNAAEYSFINFEGDTKKIKGMFLNVEFTKETNLLKYDIKGVKNFSNNMNNMTIVYYKCTRTSSGNPSKWVILGFYTSKNKWFLLDDQTKENKYITDEIKTYYILPYYNKNLFSNIMIVVSEMSVQKTDITTIYSSLYLEKWFLYN